MPQPSPYDLVNLFVGTGGFGFGVGGINPGPQVPFGKVPFGNRLHFTSPSSRIHNHISGLVRVGPDTSPLCGVEGPQFEHFGGYVRKNPTYS